MIINLGTLQNIESLEAIFYLYTSFFIEIFQKELNSHSIINNFNLYSSKGFELENFLIENFKKDDCTKYITQIILKNKLKKYKTEIKNKYTKEINIEYKIPFLKFERINDLEELDSKFFKLANGLKEFDILYNI